MRTPINCPIGSWKLTIKTSLKAGIGNNTYDHPESIFILLNPWHFGKQLLLTFEGNNPKLIVTNFNTLLAIYVDVIALLSAKKIISQHRNRSRTI